MSTRDPFFTGAAFHASAGHTLQWYQWTPEMVALKRNKSPPPGLPSWCDDKKDHHHATTDYYNSEDLVFAPELQQVFRANLHYECGHNQNTITGITGIGIQLLHLSSPEEPPGDRLVVRTWHVPQAPVLKCRIVWGSKHPSGIGFLTIVQVFGERRQGRKLRRCASQKTDSDKFKWRDASASKNCVFWSTQWVLLMTFVRLLS